MHVETLSLLSTIAINAVVGGVCILIFCYFREIYPDIYAPKLRKEEYRQFIRIPNSGYFGWIYTLYQMTDREILTNAGFDAYVHIRFLRLCATLSLLCCIILPILLPIYSTGESIQDTNSTIVLSELAELSMANLPLGSNRLWASLIMAYVVYSITLICFYYEYQHFVEIRTEYMSRIDQLLPLQTSYSIMIEDIPQEISTTPLLIGAFDRIFPGKVITGYVAVNCPRLEQLVIERKNALIELEKYIAEYEFSNKKIRPILKKSCFNKYKGSPTDAIDYYQDQVDLYSQLIRLLQKEVIDASNGESITSLDILDVNESYLQSDTAIELNGSTDGINYHKLPVELKNLREKMKEIALRENPPILSDEFLRLMETYETTFTTQDLAPTGFITFNSLTSQVIASQFPLLFKDYKKLKVSPAPYPTDILWKNISVSPTYTASMNFFVTLGYYFCLSIWGIILTFISAISNLQNLEKYLPFLKELDDATYAFLQGIIPVIIMAVFLSLIPTFMYWISFYIEKRKCTSDIDLQVFKWFFLYQLTNVYLMLITGSAINAISDLIDNPTSFISLVTSSLPSASLFFFNYISALILTGTADLFVRLSNFVIFFAYKIIFNQDKITVRTILEGPLAPTTVSYGTELPGSLYVFIIMCLYWMINPLIILFGTFYFFAYYQAWKYQYMYIIERVNETKGKYWKGLFYYSMLALMISSIIFIAYLGLKEGYYQVPAAVPLPVLIYYGWNLIDRTFDDLGSSNPFDTSVEIDNLNKFSEQHKDSYYPEHELSKPDTVTSPFTLQESSPSVLTNRCEEISNFSPNYLYQECIHSPYKLEPIPHRINGTPLFNKGTLDEIYYAFKEKPHGFNFINKNKEI